MGWVGELGCGGAAAARPSQLVSARRADGAKSARRSFPGRDERLESSGTVLIFSCFAVWIFIDEFISSSYLLLEI